ncbi:MAG: radical SAM protein [Elusimicrobia bacterium]|nr:radical SAM protein [Elusimicrobiota bacterium]
MSRVALVQPPVWGIYDPPTALAQLSSCLKAAGHEVLVCDLNIELYRRRLPAYRDAWAIERSSFWTRLDDVRALLESHRDAVEEALSRLAAFRPDLVGLSVNTCSWPAARELARRLKERLPQARLAAGGPLFCVPSDPAPLRDAGVDFVVRGEGEKAFVELAGGRTVPEAGLPPLMDLDALPFLDLEAFPLDLYDPPGHMGRHISLMTSRGCVQQCVFCGPRAYWDGFRTMSGRRIYDEVRHHAAHRPDLEAIEFLDLLFNGRLETLREFCGLMAEAPPAPGLRWHANLVVRPDMDEALYRAMRAAGCRHVTFGIESGSQRVLGLMRKRYRIADADAALARAHGAGIAVTCNFMFGFPGETEADFQQTLAFLERNARRLDTAYPSRSYCTIEPHSYLAGHLDEFGVIPSPAHGQYWRSRDGSNTYPERLRRCEEFSRRARELGIHVGEGLQTSVEKDKWLSLGDYHESCGEREEAARCLRRYLECAPEDEAVRGRLAALNPS